MININVKPAISLSQVFAKKLIAEKRPGSIVHVSSQASLVAIPDHLSYGASKAAMDHLAKTMALEWGKHNVS